MNFAPFNVLEFDGAFPQLTIASWLPTFPQPGRVLIPITDFGSCLVVAPSSMIKTVSVPDPWRATSARTGPDPTRSSAIRDPPNIVSSLPVYSYQPSHALPSNVGFQIKLVPDPRRGTSTPLYGPFKPFIIPEFLSWQPTYVQAKRPVLRSPGTDHVKDVWRFPEAVSADKWQPNTVQPSRVILRASGTDTVLSRELITADKWLPTCIQPSRQVVRAVGTNLVGHDIMPFDLLIPLSQATVSITGGVALSSTAFGRMHVCTGTSTNYNVTLPSPTNNSGSFIGFIMGSGLTKLVTILQNAAEKIDGANSRVMWASEVAILYCDGTNWIKVYGKSIPMACQMTISVQQTILNNTNTYIILDTTALDNTGQMADTTNHQIKAVRSGSYTVSASALWNSIANGSGNTQMRVTRNASVEAALTLTTVAAGGGPSMFSSYVQSATAINDVFAFYVFQLSGASTNIYNGAGFTSLLVSENPTW